MGAEVIVVDAAERLEEAGHVVESIKSVLVAERATQFLTAFQSMALCARELADDPEAALREMSQIFRGLQGGYGTFSDLVLWRDDFAERKRVNEHFEDLTGRLSKLVAQQQ